jgi:hypothetical protein
MGRGLLGASGRLFGAGRRIDSVQPKHGRATVLLKMEAKRQRSTDENARSKWRSIQLVECVGAERLEETMHWDIAYSTAATIFLECHGWTRRAANDDDDSAGAIPTTSTVCDSIPKSRMS